MLRLRIPIPRGLDARLVSTLPLLAALGACGGPAPSTDAGTVASSDALEVVPVLHFEGDGSVWASGPLVAGGRVRIDYSGDRATCRGETGGQPFWAATAHYRLNGGPENTCEAGGIVNDHRPDAQVIALPQAGELELWFENGNGWGCHDTDPPSGNRFHFRVEPGPGPSGWAGNAVSIITRATCTTADCAGSSRPLAAGFRYDDWSWSRATKQELAFEVWIPGVTDRDNPALWRDLDVRLYARAGGLGAFRPYPVAIDRRVGNNVRYTFPLAALDPFRGDDRPDRRAITEASECPTVPYRLSPDGMGIEIDVELYFTLNGVPLRPQGAEAFWATYATTMYTPGACAALPE